MSKQGSIAAVMKKTGLLALSTAIAFSMTVGTCSTAFAEELASDDSTEVAAEEAQAEEVVAAQDEKILTAKSVVEPLTGEEESTPSESTDPVDEGDSTPSDELDKSTVKPSLVGKGSMSDGTAIATKTVKSGKQIFIGKKAGQVSLATFSLKLKVSSAEKKNGYETGITYRVRVGSKWSAWKSDGESIGTAGKAFNAIQVKLKKDAAQYYDVWYKVNFNQIGNLGWTKNGDTTGIDQAKAQVRGITLVLKKKGSDAPGKTAYNNVSLKGASLSVTAYVGGKAKAAVKAKKTAGKAKKSASALSGVYVQNNSKIPGTVKVSTYSKDTGWSKHTADQSDVAKSTGKITGIRLCPKGDFGKKYDLYYRVFIKGYGWMGWAKSGAKAGTDAYDTPITAIQVRVGIKGIQSSLNQVNPYSGKDGVLSEIGYAKKLSRVAKNLSSSTGYCIVVDTHINRVGIFKGSKGAWTLYKFFKCTSGAFGSQTVKGVFHIGSRGYHFGEEKGYTCWYYTQISGNYLFHSVLYSPGSKSSIIDGRLGINASHGCVRLHITMAKWIFDNIPYGTTVKIY